MSKGPVIYNKKIQLRARETDVDRLLDLCEAYELDQSEMIRRLIEDRHKQMIVVRPPRPEAPNA